MSPSGRAGVAVWCGGDGFVGWSTWPPLGVAGPVAATRMKARLAGAEHP